MKILYPKAGERVSFLTTVQKAYMKAETERAEFVGREIDFLNLREAGEDRSFPENRTARWTGEEDDYTLTFFPNRYREISLNCTSPSCDLPWLPTGCRVMWKIVNNRTGEEANSVFYTEKEFPRMVKAEGITNVRDMGGWPTGDGRKIRQGNLFRGSEFDRHCELTEIGREVLLRELHLKTDLDLRGESDPDAPGPLDAYGVRRFRIPVTAYAHIFDPEAMKAYGECFKVMADPENYPCYIHCWGGADRTGTLAYLFQALMGVEKENLILDYELTTMSIWEARYRKFDQFQDFMNTLTVNFGGVQASEQEKARRYLLVCGVSEDELERLYRLNIEP